MYSLLQKRCMAREIARAGGNVKEAWRILRDGDDYETFRKLNYDTLRKFMREPGFTEDVAAQAKLLLEAERQEAAEAERERARREMQGSILERIAGDERLLDEARQRLFAVLKEQEKVNPSLAVRAFSQLSAIVDRRRNALIPAIAETAQATMLVESVMEAAVERMGHAEAKILISKVRDFYEEKVQRAELARREETSKSAE